jgi:conjugal transfer pilus assembly protein TraF
MFQPIIAAILLLGSIGAGQAANLLTEGPEGEGATAGGQKTHLEHFHRGEEGWFWYDDPREMEEAPPPTEPPPPQQAETAPPPPQQAETAPPPPAVFSAKWLKEKLPELRETAVDHPTNENVKAYLYAQRVMFDKADVFTDRMQQVVMTDPLLDENNRFPFATAFRSGFLTARDDQRNVALKDLASRAGLLYFFSGKCDFCRQQVKWLERMSADYGFVVKYISIDGTSLDGSEHFVVDQGLAKRLGISVVPAIVLANPPDTYIVVSQGYLARTTLENRIFVGAESQDLIPKELLMAARPERRGIMQPGDLDGAQDVGDDPKALVDFVQKSIGINSE